MVTGTPTLPVMVCAPNSSPGTVSVMVSLLTLRPDSAKRKRWVPEPTYAALTMRTFGSPSRTPMDGVVASQGSVTSGVQSASPPPLRFTVFVPDCAPTAVLSTSTGMRMSKVPGATPAATLQLEISEPAAGQPLRTPVVVLAISTGGPASVMPVGSMSSTNSGAVVGSCSTFTATV
ncbi:hypothetical protein D3C85_286480 [compost metagenome]